MDKKALYEMLDAYFSYIPSNFTSLNAEPAGWPHYTVPMYENIEGEIKYMDGEIATESNIRKLVTKTYRDKHHANIYSVYGRRGRRNGRWSFNILFFKMPLETQMRLL